MKLNYDNLFRGKSNNGFITIFTKIIGVSALVFLMMFSMKASAATLLQDDFTGTTIDTTKWVEVESQPGGTVGVVQQNGSFTITSLSGGMTLGTTGMRTFPTYSRSTNGDITLDIDVTSTVCGSASFFLGYGDFNPFTGGTSAYFIQSQTGGNILLSYYNNGSSVSNASTSFACTDNTPFHVKMVVKAAGGVDIYMNGSGTVSATLPGGTFTDKSFFFEMNGASRTATYDNLVISGTGVAPNAPTSLLSTTNVSSQIGLSWTTPSGNGSALTDYVIEYKLSSDSTWQTFAEPVSTATTATITGLTNGSPYDLRVSAVSISGTSTPSSTTTATPLLVPGAPTGLTVSPYSGRASLTWSAPANNGAVVTDYIVEYKPAGGSFSTFNDGVSSTASATVTGLTNDTTYDFRVTAVSSAGSGIPSTVTYATPGNIALRENFSGPTIDSTKWVEADASAIGATVGNVKQENGVLTTTGTGPGLNGLRTASVFSTTNGNVSIDADVTVANCTLSSNFMLGYGDFNVNTNPGDAVHLQLWSTNGRGQVIRTSNNVASAAGDSVSNFSCVNGVPFHVRLIALQAGGVQLYINNNSATPLLSLSRTAFTGKSFFLQSLQSGNTTFDNVSIIAQDVPPGAPTGIVATPTENAVGLTWTAPLDNSTTITDYIIEYKPTSVGSFSTFNDGVSTTASATVTGLTSGTSYDFRISATSANGAGVSVTASSTTLVNVTPVPPIASTVAISGAVNVDETLTGSYSYSDGNGDVEGTSLYRWLRADTSSGTYSAISGATGRSYKLTSADLGKYIKFEVTPVATVAPTTGSAVLSSATAQVTTATSFLNHILSTGQSLSLGAGTALTTTQPYNNKMLSGSSLVPLVESSAESISSSMANSITALSPGNSYQSIVSKHGVGGSAYFYIKKGTTAYNNGMAQITTAMNAAAALGLPYRVRAVTVMHGESDESAGKTAAEYQASLVEWQNDYQTDANALTGRTGIIPMFTDQMSAQNTTTLGAQVPLGQLAAAENNPTKIYLVTPKYMFTYTDLYHITNTSQRWLGEYYGKVMKKVLVDGQSWKPLSPIAITRTGKVITAKFYVPAGQLQFDTTLVAERPNYGFNYKDSTDSASIASVAITAADTVQITLNQVPTGSNPTLEYAVRGTSGTASGGLVAAAVGGNLRDTDNAPSLYGNTLYNWSVQFSKPITEVAAPSVSSGGGGSSTRVTTNTPTQEPIATPKTNEPVTCTPRGITGTKSVKIGSASKADTKGVQIAINQLNILTIPLKEDGLFGAKTYNAIKLAQKKLKLPQDGAWGKNTQVVYLKWIGSECK